MSTEVALDGHWTCPFVHRVSGNRVGQRLRTLGAVATSWTVFGGR